MPVPWATAAECAPAWISPARPVQPEFLTAEYAGHGALYDMGVYHISQILYILGHPEAGAGFRYDLSGNSGGSQSLGWQKFEVEELGLGFAKYENGLTLDILESWAIHMDNIGDSFVVGTKGGLRLPISWSIRIRC